MEQQGSNRLIIILISLTGVLALAALVVSIIALQRNFSEAKQGVEALLKTEQAVDLGPVTFLGFAGRPTSVDLQTTNGVKSFELKGHVMGDPKNTYEDVLDTDSAVKRVVIDANTKVYYISKRVNNAPPMITELSFDQFAIDDVNSVFIAYYEAGANSTIGDTTPVSTLSIFEQ